MERDPTTARGWQEAIDAAARLLDDETARRYGLVNVERCEELIEQARAYGHDPRGEESRLWARVRRTVMETNEAGSPSEHVPADRVCERIVLDPLRV
jgi:hypothetical protein